MAFSPYDAMTHAGQFSGPGIPTADRVKDRSFPTVVPKGAERPSFNRVFPVSEGRPVQRDLKPVR